MTQTISVTIHHVDPPVCAPVTMPTLTRLLPAALAGEKAAIEELYAAKAYTPVAALDIEANDPAVAAIAVYEMTTVSDELPGWVLHRPTIANGYCPILLGMVLTAGNAAFAISKEGLARIHNAVIAKVVPS